MLTSTTLRRQLRMLAAALLIALAGCAAAPPEGATASSSAQALATASAAAGTGTETAPPADRDPQPPRDEPAPAARPAAAPVVIDTSCATSADCTIKNVGNCCGEYPACVNRDSPTDPQGVQARCAQRGMASVCGFPAISACQCVAGECKGDNAAVAQ